LIGASASATMADSNRLLGVSALNLAKRKTTDGVFAALFGLFSAVAVGFGVYGAKNNNINELVNNIPKQCSTSPPPMSGAARRALLAVVASTSSDPDASADLSIIAQHAWYLLPVVLLLLIVGLLMIHGLRHCARPFVYASMAMIPISLLASAAAVQASGVENSSPSIILVAFALFYCLMLWCARDGLKLCAALLEQAAIVLMKHPSLILVGALLMLGFLLVLAAGAFAVLALLSYGHWSVRTDPVTGDSVCSWDIEDVGVYGASVVGLALLWASLLTFTMRFFIVSLVTACWYFDNAGGAVDAPSGAASGFGEARRAPVTTASKLAFTRSFGTLCFSSLVLTICQILKAMARQAQSRTNNLFVCLVACCLRCIINVIEFLNKFAVAMHAITGDDFCASGRQVTAMLSRHGLNAWFCDRISAFVLSTAAFAFAVLGGGASYIAVFYTLSDQPSDEADKRIVSSVFATTAFIIGWFILTFCASIILNIVDAAYTCLALDMDAGAPHMPPMRDAMIPIVKPDFIVVVGHPGSAGQPSAIAVPVGGPVGGPAEIQTASAYPAAVPQAMAYPTAYPTAPQRPPGA